MSKLLFATSVALLFAQHAFAYLDPGTGSMLVSAVVGVIATLLYTLRGWFYKLKNMIFKPSVPDTQEESDPKK